MGILIDSSVLIAAERGAINLEAVLARHADEQVALAAITAAELLHGVHRARTASQRARREAFVERLLAEIPVLPFDLVVARVHATLWAELAAGGEAIGAHDLLIAATAISAGSSVATRDERSFPRVPGLAVLKW
ncbi:MAG: type II toxin-antitoxin system VapC family toxin [Myxococcales bacterium]|nr:type II toxin-antitoxin system VapC family toxin [Myxococcales bacterium]